ncbi:DUF1385 domain-containing protein [Candidatus Woesearchaeota archaeon]|nr:DUF1385 domain-containing protein [Candidatus Woesearchaeota archaeon]
MSEIKIGGQAVIEGVTMRSENYVCTSVRKENGTIVSKIRAFNSVSKKYKPLGWPLIRGMVNLVEMMSIGFSELQWSGNQSVDENEELSKKEIFLTIAISIIFGVALFKLFPWFLANSLSNLMKSNYFILNVMDGILKIIIISLYLYLISLMADVKTLFRYHGAEHKVVNCYEHKKKLTPKNAQKFTTLHPRCGTTFVIIVFVVSIFVYILLPQSLDFWSNLLIRVLLLPLIAGISYEIIRFSGKYYEKNLFVRIVMWPGLQFQKLTTREPTLKQLEVAINSLVVCMNKETRINPRSKRQSILTTFTFSNCVLST